MQLDIHYLGRVDYLPTYAAMQEFSRQRGQKASSDMRDKLWICEHNPVYTQGLAGRPEHVLRPEPIPVVPTDRGGQITYHGPGQVVAYPLLHLGRAGYFVKEYVYRLEEAVLRTLLHFGVTGHRLTGAPGVYVRLDDPMGHAALARTSAPGAAPDFTGLGKIAALGLKVSRNCTYHGLALNVAMDLEPFTRINPCGYTGLRVVDLATIGLNVTWADAAEVLSRKLAAFLVP